MKKRVVFLVMVLSMPFAHALTIENEFLRFSLDGDTGAFELISEKSGLPHCTGSLGGTVTFETYVIGSDGIACTLDGKQYLFWLLPGKPFLVVETAGDVETPGTPAGSLETPVFSVDFSGDAGGVRLLGCDGLSDGKTARTSYTFLAAAVPEQQGGLVAGWLTQNRASGITLSREKEGKLMFYGRAEYGHPRHLPREIGKAEQFAIGLVEDPLTGLEAYGEAIAGTNSIVLNKPVPCGYCTWYSKPFGGACDQKHLAELADFCEKNLVPFGFDVIQIDDRWQAGRNRPKESGGPHLGFLEHNPKGPYRDGMKPVAENIHRRNMTPGLWFIPFAADPANEPAASHPEWFVKTAGGDPYYVYWAGWCLDMTQPGARDYVSQITRRITGDWGFGYFKIDGLWSGMATTCLYPEPGYRPDDLGGAVFADPASTNIEAYRSGLALVREAAGKEVFILGCNIAQNMRSLGASIGRVDGMRVGRDIGADWNNILPCVQMGSRLYFLHNRVWYNDPDCLMLREPLTLEQARAWASWIAVSGQMNLVSEWLPGLPPERLDLVKRSMPNHGLNARPLDLFENETPRIWLLSKGAGVDTHHIVAVFNWEPSASARITVLLDRIGQGAFSCFEYWEDAPVSLTGNMLDVELPPASCRVFSLRPAMDHPCVVSTSRHITQGMIDLKEEHWDAATRTLSGVSAVVGGDPYELRIALPGEGAFEKISAVQCDGGTVSTGTVQENCARVRIDSETSAVVAWRLTF